jgi:hypothetical protein
MRALNYVFENPNWIANAIWAFLCFFVAQLIPIVPQMLLTGYQFEIIEGLLATGGRRYPDFDTNRLADYLSRGVWPVLAALVVSLAWTPFFLAYIVAAIIGVAACAGAGGEQFGPVLGLFGVFLAVVLGVLVIALLVLIVTPVMIGAGLSQSFGGGFNLGWVTDFLAKTWTDVMAATLLLMFASLGITLLTCGVGGLILGGLAPFIASHFWYQFYGVYLARGGTPVVGQTGYVQPAAIPAPPPFPPKPM